MVEASRHAPRTAVLFILGAWTVPACSVPSPVGSEPPTPVPVATEAPLAEDFPDERTTGPAAGARAELVPFEGPCVLDRDGMVVERRLVDCDRLVVAADVTIRQSEVRGRIDADAEGARLTLEDSRVDAGSATAPAVGFANLTIRRSEIRGGQTSVQCSSNCLVEDSLLHGQMAPLGDQHLGGFLSNGGSAVVLRHNTIACTPPDNEDGGGCTGSVQIFADFSELSDFRFENNLIRATPGGYCASFGHNPDKPFGDAPRGIVVVDNVFERGPSGRCGTWGATTSFFEGAPGNVWESNVWEDGSVLEPDD